MQENKQTNLGLSLFCHIMLDDWVTSSMSLISLDHSVLIHKISR